MSNKPVKPASINDAIAGQPAPSARPQSVKKSASAAPPSEAKQGEPNRGGYSKSVALRIEDAATKQAKADAAKVAQFGQQVYERTLAQEVQRIFGSDADAYFRLEIEDFSLPSAPSAGYLPTLTVSALPSSN